MKRQVRHHQFVSGDGKDVDVRIVGDYTDKTLHDWEIYIDNDCHELTEADGYDAFDFLCTHVLMYPNSRHFQSLVMQGVMGDGEALSAQAAWENATQEITQ